MFVLFPHQLYYHQLHKGTFLVEEPILLGDRPNVKLRLNRLRLVYQRYLENIFVATFSQVTFVKSEDVTEFLKNIGDTPVTIYDPVDHAVLSKWQKACKNLTILETPSFLLSRPKLTEYYASKKGKKLRHAPFYAWVRRELGILNGIESQDKYNRATYPKDGPAPPAPYPRYTRSGVHATALQSAVEWVTNHPRYSTNPGNIDSVYLAKLPCTHSEALVWLDTFLAERFAQFGQYEDAIVRGEPWMFHSGLSIPLNYGLLTPADILDRAKAWKGRVPLQSYEGFIRQIIGWREYCRLYYNCIPPKVYLQNHFKFRKTKLAAAWYRGTTGVPIVDDAIKDAWRYGYLHHIRRLMVLANFMTVSEIHPDNVYRWMFEFSLDSNDVFMIFNCYSMGTYSDNGAATYKAYVSGPGYIQKQGREPGGPWVDEWRKKYGALKLKM